MPPPHPCLFLSRHVVVRRELGARQRQSDQLKMDVCCLYSLFYEPADWFVIVSVGSRDSEESFCKYDLRLSGNPDPDSLLHSFNH